VLGGGGLAVGGGHGLATGGGGLAVGGGGHGLATGGGGFTDGGGNGGLATTVGGGGRGTGGGVGGGGLGFGCGGARCTTGAGVYAIQSPASRMPRPSVTDTATIVTGRRSSSSFLGIYGDLCFEVYRRDARARLAFLLTDSGR
jgi:hypothetical protein